MDRVRNETFRTRMEMKDILQEREKQQLRWYGYSMLIQECRLARQVAE
jgi:hypothetical protein